MTFKLKTSWRPAENDVARDVMHYYLTNILYLCQCGVERCGRGSGWRIRQQRWNSPWIRTPSHQELPDDRCCWTTDPRTRPWTAAGHSWLRNTHCMNTLKDCWSTVTCSEDEYEIMKKVNEWKCLMESRCWKHSRYITWLTTWLYKWYNAFKAA